MLLRGWPGFRLALPRCSSHLLKLVALILELHRRHVSAGMDSRLLTGLVDLGAAGDDLGRSLLRHGLLLLQEPLVLMPHLDALSV